MADTVPPEIVFAQHLAANEKVKRDRALRRLKKYLFNHSSLPSGGFTETELLKIWKGLHYCMWMQDKPLIQEELSSNIASLIHSFNHPKTALLFIKTFYITECREWNTIDKWRMDKFLMMFRNMLTQAFEFLKQKKWSDKHTKELLDFISDYMLCDHMHDKSPDGVRFHLADTYLSELEAVSGGELGPKQTVTFILPWVNMISGIRSKTLRNFVIKNVFGEILNQSPVLQGKQRKKNSKKLRFQYQMIADKLLELGSSEDCLSINRPAIYNLVQNFRDVAEGKLPFAPEDSDEEEEVRDLEEDDIETAIQRLTEYNSQMQQDNKVDKRGGRRKRAVESEPDEAYGSDSSGTGEEEPSNKKSKKNQSEEEPAKTKKKKEPKEQKKKILSKKLQAILQAEQEFAEDDDEDADSEAGDDVENSEDDDELLYGDDDEEGSDEEDNELENIGEYDSADDNPSEEDMTPAKPVKRKGAWARDEKPQPAQKSKLKNNKPPTKAEIDGEVLTKTQEPGHPVKKSKKKSKKIPAKNDSNGDIGKNKEMSHHDFGAEAKTDNSEKESKKQSGKKKAPQAVEFEVEDFPESDSPDVTEFLAPLSEPSEQAETDSIPKKKKKSKANDSQASDKASKKKKTPSKPVKADKNSKKIAEFISSDAVPKAKYFKKASSKATPLTPPSSENEPKTPISEKKRLSFGKNSSVKKTAVKLRGSSSYDPTRTPEQGILKVNPIQPGTVIQVGKQATMKNTLKNSKYPQRMMAMDFF